MLSPVFGLRPVRALRVDTENVPNPEMFTLSPCFKAATMSSNSVLTARSAVARGKSTLLATDSIKLSFRHCDPFPTVKADGAITAPPSAEVNKRCQWVTMSPAGAGASNGGGTSFGWRHRPLRRSPPGSRAPGPGAAPDPCDRPVSIFDGAQDRWRNLLDVLLVLRRNEHGLDAAAMRRQDLLLEPADRQDAPAQGDLTGHRQVVAHRDLGERRHQRGRHRDTGRRSVLRDRALGNVDVDVHVLVEIPLQAQLVGARAHVAQRRLRGLLHDVAEAAGDDQLALAGHHRHLGCQQLAAELGPRQTRSPRRPSAPPRPCRSGSAAGRGTCRDSCRSPRTFAVRSFFTHLDRDLAADRGDLALQVPDAGLLRVVADDAQQRVVRDLDVVGATGRSPRAASSPGSAWRC